MRNSCNWFAKNWVDCPLECLGFIEADNANATGLSVNTGDLLDDGGGANENRFKADADGNITITAASALDVSTSGKMRVLFSVKRVDF